MFVSIHLGGFLNIQTVFNVGQVSESSNGRGLSSEEQGAEGIHYEFPELLASNQVSIALSGPDFQLTGWVEDTSYVTPPELNHQVTILYVYAAFEIPEDLVLDYEEVDEAEVDFRAGRMIKRDDESLPTDTFVPQPEGPWDDCFTDLQGIPTVTWAGAAKLTVESDAPWWVVYTEDSDGVCIEPQTAPPDAANLGITGDHYLEALFTFSEDF